MLPDHQPEYRKLLELRGRDIAGVPKVALSSLFTAPRPGTSL
jgi:hypothetical protein